MSDVKYCVECKHAEFEPFESSESTQGALMVDGIVQGARYCSVSPLLKGSADRVGCGYERKYGHCGRGAALFEL
uniref:hypothetical protein n=1 Tax=Pontibacterium sp. TaxID=2036026 RepID=UPI003568AB95